MTRPVASVLSLLAVLALVSCGAGGSKTPLPPATSLSQARIVAPTGDTEAEVRTAIAAATAAGEIARYVTVSSASQSHVFSPYALVVHSHKALIVLAYANAFVWPSDAVHVSYANANVDLATLPSVATKIDGLIESPPQVKRPKARAAFCPDCALLFRLSNHQIANLGQGLADAWQRNPDYVPMQTTQNETATRRPDLITPVLSSGCYSYYGCLPPPPPRPEPPPPPPPPAPTATPLPTGSVCSQQAAGSSNNAKVAYIVPVIDRHHVQVIFDEPIGNGSYSIRVTFHLVGGSAAVSVTSSGITNATTPGRQGSVDIGDVPNTQWDSTSGTISVFSGPPSNPGANLAYSAILTSSCNGLVN